jgi:hypothetical protein
MAIVYISGPMAGHPGLNRPAFNALAAELRAAGHIVLNPAELPDGLRYAAYMDIAMAMVRAADVLVMLEGWEKSKGAAVEANYANALGKWITNPVLFFMEHAK